MLVLILAELPTLYKKNWKLKGSSRENQPIPVSGKKNKKIWNITDKICEVTPYGNLPLSVTVGRNFPTWSPLYHIFFLIPSNSIWWPWTIWLRVDVLNSMPLCCIEKWLSMLSPVYNIPKPMLLKNASFGTSQHNHVRYHTRPSASASDLFSEADCDSSPIVPPSQPLVHLLAFFSKRCSWQSQAKSCGYSHTGGKPEWNMNRK